MTNDEGWSYSFLNSSSCIQILMRKKEGPSKSIKHKGTGSQVRKTSAKSKHKPKEPKSQQYFILLGDQFYVAASKTQRKTYQLYEQQVKAAPPTSNISPVQTNTNSQNNLDMREYVKSLSKAEKEQLFHDLQKEIQVEKESQPSIQSQQNEDKLFKLKLKLEMIKKDLSQGWQVQITRINNEFQSQQISLEEKNSKIRLVQKIRKVKLGMIDSTNVLFQKILRDDSEIQLNKQEQLQHIINSLNSMSSLGETSDIRQMEMMEVPFESEVPKIVEIQFKEKERKGVEELQKELSRQELEQIPLIPHIESVEQTKEEGEHQMFPKQSLKLEIRLDEVQFGKDHYGDQAEIKEEENQKKDAINIKETGQEVSKDDIKESDSEGSPDNTAKVESEATIKRQLESEFLCEDQQTGNKLKIPLLMTKDRLQQMQLQKSSRQIQTLNICLKNRHAFQGGEDSEQNFDHFTTLKDINKFVVSFYQFVMQRFMNEVVEGLNLAFGKSALDKLYQIRNEGFVPDYDNNNILPEELLMQYQKQIMLSERKIPESQKIHNRAVFQAFNAELNAYRPYYELEGEVFPWNTSEKGLTFYQINQDNIEEVFQKSKMKVLQFSANLCGIFPGCELTTSESIKALEKRNDESYDRTLKGEIHQKFYDWYLKTLNFQALARLSLAEHIIQSQIELFLQEMSSFIL